MVGLTCFGLALAVLAGLHDLAGTNYLIAYGASFVISGVAGYLLNAQFTFAVKSNHGGAARYLAVNAVSLCVNTAAMKLLVSVLGVWYIAAAVILAALNVPVSYFAQRLVTYRPAIRDGHAVES
jgi:putative flippase GtrA